MSKGNHVKGCFSVGFGCRLLIPCGENYGNLYQCLYQQQQYLFTWSLSLGASASQQNCVMWWWNCTILCTLANRKYWTNLWLLCIAIACSKHQIRKQTFFALFFIFIRITWPGWSQFRYAKMTHCHWQLVSKFSSYLSLTNFFSNTSRLRSNLRNSFVKLLYICRQHAKEIVVSKYDFASFSVGQILAKGCLYVNLPQLCGEESILLHTHYCNLENVEIWFAPTRALYSLRASPPKLVKKDKPKNSIFG